jgi:hypothetical protein
VVLKEAVIPEYSTNVYRIFSSNTDFPAFVFLQASLTAHARYRDTASHSRHGNNQFSQGIHMRRQVVTDMRVPNSVWKKRVSDTLHELNIIPENFSGKVVISFKEGGVSYIEKTETLK